MIRMSFLAAYNYYQMPRYRSVFEILSEVKFFLETLLMKIHLGWFQGRM